MEADPLSDGAAEVVIGASIIGGLSKEKKRETLHEPHHPQRWCGIGVQSVQHLQEWKLCPMGENWMPLLRIILSRTFQRVAKDQGP